MPLLSSLLPSLLFAQALPVVADANADLVDGRLGIEVVTSQPVSRDDVRGKLSDNALVVYVQGVTVERSRRSFARPDGRSVAVYPRADYTKLSVPFGPGLACSGGIDIAVEGDRVRASVGCSAHATASAAATTTSEGERPAQRWRPLPQRLEAAEAEAARPEPSTARPPLPTGLPVAAAPVAAPTEPASAPAPEAAAEPAAPPPVPILAVPPPRAAPPAPAAPAPHPAATASPSKGAAEPHFPGAWTLVAAVLLAGVCVVLLWRRRRIQGAGLIRILESASLGPKRALVVAEIGGRKLILGSSEAGIALISSLTARSPTPTGGVVAQGPRADDDPVVSEAGPVDPPEGEKGFLARLFSRRREEPYLPEDEGPSTMAEDFADLLDDSLDDEDLRRRLQAGVGGRTR